MLSPKQMALPLFCEFSVKKCCPLLHTLVSGSPIILLCGASVTAWCDALRSSFDEPPRRIMQTNDCKKRRNSSKKCYPFNHAIFAQG